MKIVLDMNVPEVWEDYLVNAGHEAIHWSRVGNIRAEDSVIATEMSILRPFSPNMNAYYSILIQWSDDDQCFVASLPEFGPYAHTHGETYEEALKNAREVLDLLIADTSFLPHPLTYEAYRPASVLGMYTLIINNIYFFERLKFGSGKFLNGWRGLVRSPLPGPLPPRVSQKPLSRRERGWGEGIKRSDRA